ncbi:MAG: hypothetical protein J0I32_20410 [Sphingobacteriales bacterium]|nr:hypothetical protein [Sphingobacteriales bacterium]OJV97711.1 MAG: hypothetical protein BGO52_10045 [Sphingobacteriales bacterium 44-61]
MSVQPTIEERLWEYIDGMATPEERTVIDQLIEADAEWRAKYGELLETHQMMQASELEEPSMRFTKNVMEEIALLQIAPAAKTYINKKIIWGIAIFFITMIVGFLIYGIGQVQWSSGSSSSSPIPIDLSNIDFSKMFNNTYINIFMMMNMILGLFLFDRYLANKRKKTFSNK